LNEFRSRFIGKCSPVQFFWGSFDLACTRFSGRPAPPRKGVITREAYSHEVISAGFWPGGGPVPGAAFYAYAAPSPADYRMSTCNRQPPFWSKDLSEFLLMYDDVRRADSPRAMLLDFFESTYAGAANLAEWDRPRWSEPKYIAPKVLSGVWIASWRTLQREAGYDTFQFSV